MKAAKFIIIFSILAALSFCQTFAQSEVVNLYLKKISQGKIEDVKKALPDLLAKYPDDPGVKLLHGAVIDDAFKAVEIYEDIVEKHPNDRWADDAQWRIVQFYAVKGDTSKAKNELAKLRKIAPASEFLMPATDVVRASIAINRKEELHTTRSSPPDKPAVETSDESEIPDLDEIPSAGSGEGGYGLQVGIFRTYEAALAEMDSYREKRMRATIMTKNVEEETMYAVVIGNYASKEAAEAAKVIVQQQCGCKPIVFKK